MSTRSVLSNKTVLLVFTSFFFVVSCASVPDKGLVAERDAALEARRQGELTVASLRQNLQSLNKVYPSYEFK